MKRPSNARIWLWTVVSLLCLSAHGAADLRAQSFFERMIMPGPLIKGHAELEDKCEKCHLSFDKTAQDRLCLSCHKGVASDLKDRRGFHGRRADIKGTPCKLCHTDHKGREARIVGLDIDLFDHKNTDFALHGAHTGVECSQCHVKGKKHRDAPGRCYDCHKTDDPHRSNLGEKCESCHGDEAWRKVKPYDHDATKFPLKGAHKKVRCNACHVAEHYKDLPKNCISCHGLQDVHKGRLGDRCELCHTSDKWQSVAFDHDRQTDFPLTGKHREAKCSDCHSEGAGKIPATGQKKTKARTCFSCHDKDDAHKGQLGKSCNNCHKSEGWRRSVVFDHNLTRFPLIGLHSVVPCEECHITPSFHDASRQCAKCHQDNFHKGRLGADCETCHNPNGWALWQFDHAAQTGSALNGAHAGLDCHACHTSKSNTLNISITQCRFCHSKDDIHQGAFGPRCGQCHDETNFKNTKIK